MSAPFRLDELIKDSCRQWTQHVVAPPDLADRVLADRVPADRVRQARARRVTRLAVPLAAVATVLVVGLVLALVTRLGHGTASAPPAAHTSAPAVSHDTSTHADPNHFQPTRLVAAGQEALGAFGTLASGRPGEANSETQFTWHVYDAATGRYVTVPWASVKVAPGLKEAAVMERSGTRRIGLLDLSTMKVTRWLPAPAPVSAVNWSPDGRQLVLTTTGTTSVAGQTYNARTGFTIVDVATGRGTSRSLPVSAPNENGTLDTFFLDDLGTQSVSWDSTGRLLWVPAPDMSGKRVFYDLKGHQVTPPGHEAAEAIESPISPDGRLIATTGAKGYGEGPAVSITDLASGQRRKVLIIEHADVWADDTHVIGVACDPKDCSGKGEFHNRYVLADLNGKSVPLTGVGDSQSHQAWTPQFVSRWATSG
jgi:WD40 repeat protein